MLTTFATKRTSKSHFMMKARVVGQLCIVILNSDAIHANEWNTLGVSARGSHFIFTINDWTVAELDDSRSKSGEVGIFIDVWEGQSGSVAFDNFAVQSR